MEHLNIRIYSFFIIKKAHNELVILRTNSVSASVSSSRKSLEQIANEKSSYVSHMRFFDLLFILIFNFFTNN